MEYHIAFRKKGQILIWTDNFKNPDAKTIGDLLPFVSPIVSGRKKT